MSSYLKIFTIISVLFCSAIAQDCGTVGHTGSDADDARRQDVFYINRGDPAECDGMITSVSFCFYSSETIGNFYSATFAIYRQESGNAYNAVSEPREIRISHAQYNSALGSAPQIFGCSTMNLAEPLMIQQGDVLGICVVEPDNENGIVVNRLELAGRPAGSSGNVLRIRNPAPTECRTPNTVPTTFDSNDDSSRDVYLTANIEPLSETPQPPTTPEATTLAPTTPEATTQGPTTPEATTQGPTTPEATTLAPTTPEATTQGPTTPEATHTGTTQTPTTVELTTQVTGSGSNMSNDSSGAIAAVLVVLLVLIIAAVTVVVIVLVVRRKRQRGKDLTSNNLTNINALDNEIYGKDETFNKLDSTEHTYEFQSTSYEVYAEIDGPYGYETAGGAEIVYESPLDAPAISYSKLLQKNQEENIYEGENPYEVPASRERDIYAQLKSWGVKSLLMQDLKTTGHLGSGQFGSVERGVWTVDRSRQIDVALKSLTSTEDQDKVKFLQEAAIMAQFKHPNVIKLHGVITSHKPMMLVVEMAKKGDLHKYLQSIRPDPGELLPSDTPKLLLKFSQQVALGMQYLSAKGFVHRDLAARNVLLTSTNTCKVADFGMSRDLADENYYMSHGKDKIPVKWTAPEALHFKKYSTASDVWAYGCVLYEVWSIGHKPFEGIANINAIREVDTGKRLTPPPGCPRMVYETMIMCWHPESSQRPGFRDIVITLTKNGVGEIPPNERATNPQSGVLGAPLKEGNNLYPELQNKYIAN